MEDEDRAKLRELKKIDLIEDKEVKDRTEQEHLYLIKYRYEKSVRAYLLSMGDFKDDTK